MLQSLAGSSCVRLVEQHRSAWCFALLVLGYLLYLVFGAVVFSSVELPYEDLLRQELGKLKQRFLEEHACLSEQQLEQFLMRVLEASNYGVSVLSNASGNWNWDFTSSLFFASTVLSTTGKAERLRSLGGLAGRPRRCGAAGAAGRAGPGCGGSRASQTLPCARQPCFVQDAPPVADPLEPGFPALKSLAVSKIRRNGRVFL